MPTQGHPNGRKPSPSSNLSREADHRIANSLAMISALVRLRASKVMSAEDPQVFLREIADRIETVAQLHRVIAHSSTEAVRLCDYLQGICERLSRALASEQPVFSLACSAEHIVPPTVALPLGLIIAELFSNSMKYAHPSGLPVAIAISCSRSADHRLTIVYEDDGVGFSEGFDIACDGHLGMRFIRLLGGQLDGTSEWLSDPLGIRYKLSIQVEPVLPEHLNGHTVPSRSDSAPLLPDPVQSQAQDAPIA
jgi:two-component sensor histidine kinase